MRRKLSVLAFLMVALMVAGLVVFASVMAAAPGRQESAASQIKRVTGSTRDVPEASFYMSDSPMEEEIAAPGSTR